MIKLKTIQPRNWRKYKWTISVLNFTYINNFLLDFFTAVRIIECKFQVGVSAELNQSNVCFMSRHWETVHKIEQEFFDHAV